MALEDEVMSPEPQTKFTFNELNIVFYELLSEFKKTGTRIKTLKSINDSLLDDKEEISKKNRLLPRDLNIFTEKTKL